jgi:uncharacterized membrane protein
MTEPADGSPTTTGVDARVASVLCYAGWWLTGLVFLFLEREDRAVRFHAAQSIVVFGGLSLLMMALAALTAMSLFVAPALFRGVWALNWVVWLAGVVVWLVLMLQTFRGPGWRVPLGGGRPAAGARPGG